MAYYVKYQNEQIIQDNREDKEIIYELTENEILANKISILEAENKALKEELLQIQMSLASLISEVSEK